MLERASLLLVSSNIDLQVLNGCLKALLLRALRLRIIVQRTSRDQVRGH